MERIQDSNYKWVILALAALTSAIVVALQPISMSVLFQEISTELGLTLVQVGFIWGFGTMPLILTGILAGAAGDRFGPKRILVTGTLLAGTAGALRGLSVNFPTLVLFVGILGTLSPFVIMSAMKTCGVWFPRRQLGMATGIISMGMALGFLLGSLLSATVMSPWLGGWRNVFFFYGAISALFCIPWFFTRPAPDAAPRSRGEAVTPLVAQPSMQQAVLHVARKRNAWLLGLALMGMGGGIQGLLGYLPLYLRNLGWPVVQADGSLAAFHTFSLLAVLPITLYSDRLGSRKIVLLGANALIMSGIFLLSFLTGPAIWFAVILSGIARDGAMALFMTMVIETEGIGPLFAGTATGFLTIFAGIGGLFAPPLGNSLAGISASAPFLFWAGLVLFAIACLSLARVGPRA
jgi:MFS family permease